MRKVLSPEGKDIDEKVRSSLLTRPIMQPSLKHLKNGIAQKTKRHSMICDKYDVVAVPFPFADC